MNPTPDIELETLAAFGQLVASVTHKLNNDLTAARGYSDLLDEDLRELACVDERLKDVAEQAESLRREIHSASNAIQLLAAFALGRRAPGSHTPAALIDQVISVVGASWRAAGITVEREVAADLAGLPDATVAAFQRTLLLVFLVCQRALSDVSGTRCIHVSARAIEGGGVRASVCHAGTIPSDARATNRIAAAAAFALDCGGTLTTTGDSGQTTYVLEIRS